MILTFYCSFNHGSFYITPYEEIKEIEHALNLPLLHKLLNISNIELPDTDFIYESIFYCQVDVFEYSVVKILEITDIKKWLVSGYEKKVEKNHLKNLKAITDTKTMLAKSIERQDFIIPEDISIDQLTWDFLLSSIDLGIYLLLHGPTGAGKTTIIYAAAKQLGYDFFPINCGTLIKPESTLIGSVQAKEGSTFLVESEFLKYYTSSEPTLIFLNELTRTPPAATNYMMSILDKQQSYIYVKELGKRLYKGPHVKFIADCNIGKRYTDTRNLDAAFMNRFLKIDVSYLPEEKEVALIKAKVPDAQVKDIRSLVSKANLIRDQEDTLLISISTRDLIEMSKYLTKDFSVKEIVEKIMKNIFIDTHSSNKEIISKIFDSNS